MGILTSLAGFVRPVGIIAVVALGLGACQTIGGSSNDANLTPAQRQLRQEAERFNQTVAEGAIVGAIGGAIIGALVSDDDPLAGAAIGAAGGAALGAGAGYFVASQNESYASREAQLNAQIQAAQQDVSRYRTIVRTTQTVVDQHKARIAQLNAQAAAGRVTADQVRQETAVMREDLELIDNLIAENRTIVEAYEGEISTMRQEGRSTTQLSQARNDMLQERAALQAQYDELLRAVEGVGTATS